jgi:Cu/Ag efflux protein CusF
VPFATAASSGQYPEGMGEDFSTHEFSNGEALKTGLVTIKHDAIKNKKTSDMTMILPMITV